MRKLLLTVFLILVMSKFSLADTVTIDTSGWTIDQRGSVEALAVKILFDDGITYSDINVNLPTIEVISPSASISGLTSQRILDEYTARQILLDANNATAQAEEQARKTEFDASPYKDMNLSQIDNFIDTQVNAINNLADAKTFLKSFLKKLVRYLKARGV